MKAFQDYKDKNFTIIGISLDNNKDKWLKAIADDNLTWTHVSDLKYWDSEIPALYGVRGIPANVLLNPDGVIIAKNITGFYFFFLSSLPYKNFFQDKFGPGHIVSDTIAAGNYLRREMASYTETEGEIAEPTVTLRITVSSVKKFLNKNYNL